MSSSIAALKGDPALDAAAKVAKTLRPGLGDPMQSLEGLHLMKVAIDKVVPLEGAAEGLRLIQDRKVIGKVVVTP